MAGAAKGTSFLIGTIPVAELTSIGGVSVSAETIDVTTLDSTDGYRKFLGGVKDGGEVSLSGLLKYTDAGQKAIYTAFESGTIMSCSINFPPAISASWKFDGLVTAFETGAELDGAVSMDATVKVSGKPTLA